MPAAARIRSAGFSLVEVLVALSILTGVLLGVAAMFGFANGLLHSGRDQTVALSIARDIVEEMDGWYYAQTWTEYGLDGSASEYVVDSRVNAFAAKWQAALDRDLSGARAEVRLNALADPGPPPALSASSALRVSVEVHWNDGKRTRSVSLATVRI